MIVAQPSARVMLLVSILIDRFLIGLGALHGTPCFPFYRPRESTGYSEGKEKNERGKKAFRITGSFSSFVRVPPTL